MIAAHSKTTHPLRVNLRLPGFAVADRPAWLRRGRQAIIRVPQRPLPVPLTNISVFNLIFYYLSIFIVWNSITIILLLL